MTSKKRIHVRDRLAAEVTFAVDLRCCLCEAVNGLPPRVRNGQIHHLDGNPSNNAVANLVWLCLEHHEEAGKSGHASRRTSPELIRRYRDHLENRILRDREHSKSSRTRTDHALYVAALNAQVVMHLMGLRTHSVEEDWAHEEHILCQIAAYPPEIGFEARRAVLDAINDIAARTRFKMPRRVARFVQQQTVDLLPLRTVRPEGRRRLSKEDRELLSIAVEIGEALAYDGALYVQNLEVLESGCEILWRILSLARTHALSSLVARVKDAFETALDGANRSGISMAASIVKFAERYGHEGNWRPIKYPSKIEKAISADCR